MKTSTLLPIIAVLALVPLGTTSAYCPNCSRCVQGGPSYGSTVTMTPARKVNTSTQLTIDSITEKSLIVKGGKSPQTFKIDSKTKIRINGRVASLADLKPGMAVEVGATSIYPPIAYSIAAAGSASK